MPDWIVLYNPNSRRGASVARRARPRIESLRPPGTNGVVWIPLAELKDLRASPERILAVGGDGTVNAAASWLNERGVACPIGIVPAGTGNNLARGLGLPLDLEPALELACGPPSVRAVDGVLYAGGSGGEKRLMVQTAALGYPAHIAAKYDTLRRGALLRTLFKPVGPHVYRLLAFAGLVAQKWRERRGEALLEVECRMPGETLRETVFAVFIGNERSIGGDFHPCPRAELDDGRIDICLVRAGTGASYLKVFKAFVRGEHLAIDRTIVYRQTEGPLEIMLSEPSELLADGDLWLKDRQFRFEVLPRRFQIIAKPASKPGDSTP